MAAEDLSGLWGRRARAFWKEASIYWSYVARSGLTAFLLLFIIVGGIVYNKILALTPTDYPYWRIAAPILTLVLGWTPLRTFLRPADTVFLMPAESKLRGYWLRAGAYSFGFQAGAALIGLVMIWPLYRHCEGPEAMPFITAFLFLATAKLAAVAGRFHEGRLLYPVHRMIATLIRWLASLIAAFALLVQGPAAAWGALLLGAVVLGVTLFLLPKHRIPWEHWIQKEAGHLKNHYTFFSWFADVPKHQGKPKGRHALARQFDRLPYSKSAAYRYLYGKTLLRSEWFDILLRLTGIAVLLLAVVENVVAQTVIYAVITIMSTATVSSLEQSHRYSFWPELYPVPKEDRVQAIVHTCRLALFPANAIAGTAFLVLSSNRLAPLVAIPLGLLSIWYYTRYPLAKKAALRDE